MKSKEETWSEVKEKIMIANLLAEEEIKKERKIGDMVKPMVAALVMMVSLSGMVFAKDISYKICNQYFTGSGVEKAINEGYIENTEMEEQNSNSTTENEETGEVIEDHETSIKVSDLVMDDFTLSMTFEVTLSDKIKTIITANEVMEMNFSDVVVYDENNIILNTVYDNELDQFKNKTKIEPKEMVNSGVNFFVSEKSGNQVKVIYNFYTGGDNYPKSKELHVDMNKIKIAKQETIMGDEEITIKGDWNFKVDVPAKMYNRQNTIYKQKSTTNQDFNVQSAVLYHTGMEIGMKFKAEKLLNNQEIASMFSPELAFYYTLDEKDALKSIDLLNYLENKERSNPKYQELSKKEREKWEFEKYLTNSKGERFEFTMGPRENGSAYIDEDGIMTSTCMFDLTNYDATDEVTLHLAYKGTKAEIVLEKVKE